MACGTIDLMAIERDRDQLWAEACHYYHDGAAWWPEGEETALASVAQEARYEADAWEGEVSRWLTHRPGVAPTVGEVLEGAIGLQRDKWTRAEQMRVAAVLKRLGYARRSTLDAGVQTWRYSPTLGQVGS